MKNNVIPRSYKKIIAKIKINVGDFIEGDIIHVFKNEYNETLITDTKNQKNYYANFSLLRNNDLVEFIEIIK